MGSSLSLNAARQLLQEQFSIGPFHAEDLLALQLEMGVLRLHVATIDDGESGLREWHGGAIQPAMITTGQIDCDENILTLPSAKMYGASTTLSDFRRVWPALASREPSTRKGIGGRPSAADWAAVEEAVRQEIAAVGHPCRTNEPGWQTLADVCRWVEEQFGRNEDMPAPTTVKQNVKRILERIKDGN